METPSGDPLQQQTLVDPGQTLSALARRTPFMDLFLFLFTAERVQPGRTQLERAINRRVEYPRAYRTAYALDVVIRSLVYVALVAIAILAALSVLHLIAGCATLGRVMLALCLASFAGGTTLIAWSEVRRRRPRIVVCPHEDRSGSV